MPQKKGKKFILLGALAICSGTVLFLFYGPFNTFRLLWINTAMYSSRHQFLATMLYPKTYIEKVLDMPFPQEQTDPQPLEEVPGDVILFAEITGNYYRGYIILIEDPRRLSLITARDKEGELLEDMVAALQGIGGVNGAGFLDHNNRGLPWGTVISDGILMSECTWHSVHTIGGLTKANKLTVGRMTNQEITERDFKWAFEFGPILIINGEKTELNSHAGGLAPRTAIGQTQEGYILLVVIDGRQISSIGATFQDVQTVLYANGAINAIGLDGGASSCMFYEGQLVNSPSEGNRGRFLPNALVIR
jgi:exopolysaccharide biosynthesis protein